MKKITSNTFSKSHYKTQSLILNINNIQMANAILLINIHQPTFSPLTRVLKNRLYQTQKHSILKQSYIANYEHSLSAMLETELTFDHHNFKSVVDRFPNVTLQNISYACEKKHDLVNPILKNDYEKSQIKPFQNQISKNHTFKKSQISFSNTSFYSAQWVIDQLQMRLEMRNSNVKRIMQEFFEKAQNNFFNQRSKGNIVFKGLTLTISGRLSKSKIGMAKTVSKTIGRVPLSGLKQKVDYGFGVASTKLGALGIKVWILY